MKTDIHKACGFSYIIERIDGEVFGPVPYRGEDAVYSFLVSILEEEQRMWAHMADKKALVMTREDWQKHKNATDCHICNKSLWKNFVDSISVHDHNTALYCGQSHKICYYQFMNKIGFVGPKREIREWGQPNGCKIG